MPVFKKILSRQKWQQFSIFEFFAKIAKHKNAYISKTVLDRADCADFGCHNSIRLETKHFLNTLALTFISFSGRFVFAMQKHYLFFLSYFFFSTKFLKHRVSLQSSHANFQKILFC